MTQLSCLLKTTLIGCFALYLSACIEGSIVDIGNYSAIFVTNNTPETLYVTVNTNEAESLWSAGVEAIEPYKTERVLRLVRNSGQSEGTVLSYSTFISNSQGEGIYLEQELISKTLSDDIQFGLEADDLQTGFKTNSDLYRYTSYFDTSLSNPSRVAFKAKSKSFFKDVYYSVTAPAASRPLNENEDELSIATYNVWGLPFVSSDISRRFSFIPEQLQGFDVLVLQEAFDAKSNSLLAKLAEAYPYQTAVLNAGSSNVHNGGVVIVSRFPLVNEMQATFPDCAGSDCLADKGIMYAEAIKGGKSYHILATHAASFDDDDSRANRRKQFKQMREFAQSLNISAADRVIYAGDLNVNKLRYPNDYTEMLSLLQADEPAYSGYTKATFDPDINEYATSSLSGSKNPEYLDYILMSNEYGSYQENTNEVFIIRQDHKDLWQLWDLSDHFPVSTTIK